MILILGKRCRGIRLRQGLHQTLYRSAYLGLQLKACHEPCLLAHLVELTQGRCGLKVFQAQPLVATVCGQGLFQDGLGILIQPAGHQFRCLLHGLCRTGVRISSIKPWQGFCPIPRGLPHRHALCSFCSFCPLAPCSLAAGQKDDQAHQDTGNTHDAHGKLHKPRHLGALSTQAFLVLGRGWHDRRIDPLRLMFCWQSSWSRGFWSCAWPGIACPSRLLGRLMACRPRVWCGWHGGTR